MKRLKWSICMLACGVAMNMAAQEMAKPFGGRLPSLKLVVPELGKPDMRSRLEVPALNSPTRLSLSVDSLAYNPISMSIRPQMMPTEEPFAWHGNIYSRDFVRDGTIWSWGSGGVLGASSYETLATIGNIAAAGVTVVQHVGERWTVWGGVTAQKYNMVGGPYFPNVYNNFGFDAGVGVKVTDNISFSAFGSYQSNGFYNSMAAMPYVSQSNVGGYMSVLTDNQKWGVDMGAQSYYDPYGRRWVTVPIVRPYFNLNGQKLGIDVGGLLYQIFDNLLGGRDRDYGSWPSNGGGNGGGSIRERVCAPSRIPPSGF